MIVDNKWRFLNQSRSLIDKFLQGINEGTVLWEFTSISYTGYHPNLPLFRSGELKIHQSQKLSVTSKRHK